MLRVGGHMYDLTEAIQIYEEELRINPEYDHQLVAEWREDMPGSFTRRMLEKRYGCHIVDENMYNMAISLLVWPDEKTVGAKWSVSDIKSVVGIDFNTKKYTLLDFAYVMNMLWSDYSNIFVETNYYIKMARNYLEDADYMGDASERAYKNALERICHFHKQYR